MATPAAIREARERKAELVRKRPSAGRGTAVTKARVRDGTTCEIEDGKWTLVSDVGTASGGNAAGPDPGVLARASLASCLAIGYATWAAQREVPLTALQVEVEADYDAAGELGLHDGSPGWTELRYTVRVESPAPEEAVRRLLDEADAHSPILDDFSRGLSVGRQVEITGGS